MAWRDLWLKLVLERHARSEATLSMARELARAENEAWTAARGLVIAQQTEALLAQSEAQREQIAVRVGLIKDVAQTGRILAGNKERVEPAPLPADFGEQVHQLLYAQFGRQAREAGELEELEELGEAIIALAEGYREGQPPPGSDEMPALSKHAH